MQLDVAGFVDDGADLGELALDVGDRIGDAYRARRSTSSTVFVSSSR